MKKDNIEILIQKYLNGETTPEEEKALALEVSREDAPQEWKIIAELLGELTVDEALYDKMMAERNKKPRIIKFWPWLVAACVAGLFMVFLAPPRAPHPPRSALATLGLSKKGELQIAQVTEDSTKHNKEPQHLIANAEHKAMKKKETSVPVIKNKEPLSGKTECVKENETEYQVAQEDPVQGQKDVDVTDNPAATQAANSTVKSRVLTERDIPVTRPENLKYTKEELALMRKQANEAYIKWVELELEIARYNQEQTAQK